MTTFYAQPYDISASGFYFEDEASFTPKIDSIFNDFGQKAEEFEIQFIDGDLIDRETCKTIGLCQGNIVDVMNKLNEWDTDQKTKLIIAVGECSYSFDLNKDNPDDFDVQIYADMTMQELAEQFVDEGLFGEIPDQLASYIDCDAIARDLAMDYTETSVARQRLIYRMD